VLDCGNYGCRQGRSIPLSPSNSSLRGLKPLGTKAQSTWSPGLFDARRAGRLGWGASCPPELAGPWSEITGVQHAAAPGVLTLRLPLPRVTRAGPVPVIRPSNKKKQ
jgi:hypothetical protein